MESCTDLCLAAIGIDQELQPVRRRKPFVQGVSLL
jgi:hypothetical protein